MNDGLTYKMAATVEINQSLGNEDLIVKTCSSQKAIV